MKKKCTAMLISIVLCSTIGIIVPNLSGHEFEHTTELSVEDCGCQGTQNLPTIPFGHEYRVMSSPIKCTQLTITKPTHLFKDT